MIFDTIFLCIVLGLLGYIGYRALSNVKGEEEEESKEMGGTVKKHDCTITKCSHKTDACKNKE